TSTYQYDSLGRLSRAEDPAGGFQTIARTDLFNGHEITETSALGRSRKYRVEDLSTGDQLLTNTAPDGTVSQSNLQADGTNLGLSADGSQETRLLTADPRFGMQAATTKTESLTLPGVPTFDRTYTNTAVLADSTNPLSVQ